MSYGGYLFGGDAPRSFSNVYRRKCLFRSPSFCNDSIPQGNVGDPCFARPVRNRLRLSFVCNPANGSSIFSLFGARCPANIARLVVTVVVYSFDGHPRMAVTHNPNKSAKAAHGFVHGNAPSSPIMISDCLGVIASPNHAGPALIDARPGKPVSGVTVHPSAISSAQNSGSPIQAQQPEKYLDQRRAAEGDPMMPRSTGNLSLSSCSIVPQNALLYGEKN